MTRIAGVVPTSALANVSVRQVREGLDVLAGVGLEREMSFAECVAMIFTDSGLDRELDCGRAVFGEPVDTQLRQLSRLVEWVDDHIMVRPGVDDSPAVVRCRRLAALILPAVPEP